jgi:hypothetical protein
MQDMDTDDTGDNEEEFEGDGLSSGDDLSDSAGTFQLSQT